MLSQEKSGNPGKGFEPDVGQLLVDALHLRFLALAVADVGDEDRLKQAR
jgi:hypothetical protein